MMIVQTPLIILRRYKKIAQSKIISEAIIFVLYIKPPNYIDSDSFVSPKKCLLPSAQHHILLELASNSSVYLHLHKIKFSQSKFLWNSNYSGRIKLELAAVWQWKWSLKDFMLTLVQDDHSLGLSDHLENTPERYWHSHKEFLEKTNTTRNHIPKPSYWYQPCYRSTKVMCH